MLDIQKDGLTYVIEHSLALDDGNAQSWLLREDSDGWLLWQTQGDAHRIGRRKTWQKALHDALVYIENKAHSAYIATRALS